MSHTATGKGLANVSSNPALRVGGGQKLHDWHDTQNANYLELLRRRLREPRLMWVEQFIGLIREHFPGMGAAGGTPVRINDFGCNVGHFYRGCEDFDAGACYTGYDISQTYLSIAREAFGAAAGFELIDFASSDSRKRIRPADVAVISATLEHVENFESALDNVFATTSRLVLLRTFVGEQSLKAYCRTEGASSEYLIRQFTFDELTAAPLATGWHVKRVSDQATGGKEKMVCNGKTIPRTQSILAFRRKAE